MQKELQMWTEENSQHVKSLKAEQRFVNLPVFRLVWKSFKTRFLMCFE